MPGAVPSLCHQPGRSFLLSAGEATTSFIERNATELFSFGATSTVTSTKLLTYLAGGCGRGRRQRGGGVGGSGAWVLGGQAVGGQEWWARKCDMVCLR